MSSERDIFVTITADVSKFVEAMRKAQGSLNRFAASLLHWHSPSSPYRHWPTCSDPVGPPHEFWIPLGYACPGCGAAL